MPTAAIALRSLDMQPGQLESADSIVDRARSQACCFAIHLHIAPTAVETGLFGAVLIRPARGITRTTGVTQYILWVLLESTCPTLRKPGDRRGSHRQGQSCQSGIWAKQLSVASKPTSIGIYTKFTNYILCMNGADRYLLKYGGSDVTTGTGRAHYGLQSYSTSLVCKFDVDSGAYANCGVLWVDCLGMSFDALIAAGRTFN